jgi:uncharacterized protein YjbJ (UPF0337 family)
MVRTTTDQRRWTMSNHDRIEGKSKEVVGKVSGDDELEAEGKVQHAKGTVEQKVDELKDTAKGAAKAVQDAISHDDDEDDRT